VTDPREHLLRSAIRVSLFSVVWSLVVGTAAVVSGTIAGSLALIGFGLDSAVDGSASVVLVWRFRHERDTPEHAHRVEHLARRFIGITLYVIAVYIVVQAVRALVSHDGPSNTAVGDALATASILVLPGIAIVKFRLAAQLRSRALRGDGILTLAGAVLALVALVALFLNSEFGWWWCDAVAALLIALFLAREGRVALRAE